MLKKVLTATVFGVSALGVMVANAAAPGVYVTGQLGYANTHMGNKTTLPSFESKEGKVTFDKNNLNNNGLAGRLAIGYQFNQTLAIEMGYLQLGQKKSNFSGELTPKGLDPVNVNGSFKLSQYAIDLAAKGILPISDKFNVYGKLGVAYLTTTTKNIINSSASGISIDNDSIPTFAKHKWAPEAAVGVSYDITPNVSVDTSWTHIQPMGNKRPGNIDFVAVSIGYNFG